MTISELEDYLLRCGPSPARSALLDALDALNSSAHLLYVFNGVAMTKLTKSAPHEEAGQAQLFPL